MSAEVARVALDQPFFPFQLRTERWLGYADLPQPLSGNIHSIIELETTGVPAFIRFLALLEEPLIKRSPDDEWVFRMETDRGELKRIGLLREIPSFGSLGFRRSYHNTLTFDPLASRELARLLLLVTTPDGQYQSITYPGGHLSTGELKFDRFKRLNPPKPTIRRGSLADVTNIRPLSILEWITANPSDVDYLRSIEGKFILRS